MNKKGRVLFWLIFVLLILSSFAKYYTFFELRNFYVTTSVGCDPDTEECFVWLCSPEEDGCSDEPYKYISVLASDVEVCDPYTEECDELACVSETANESCEYTYCSESTAAEDEICI